MEWEERRSDIVDVEVVKSGNEPNPNEGTVLGAVAVPGVAVVVGFGIWGVLACGLGFG